MIIMPHIDGCTIVTESGFCSVMGHPYDIIEGLFIKRTKFWRGISTLDIILIC